jgi:hypothetical protein
MASWSGDEHGFGPELWHQQSEDFVANFLLKGKSDFRSMREVRSYALKDRYVEPERGGGSEWEPIKILLEGAGNSNKMNAASNTLLQLTT